MKVAHETDGKKVIMIRSHYPDSRLEKEGRALIRNGFTITQVGWDRRHDTDACLRSSFAVKKMHLPIQPGSLRLIPYLPIWWAYISYVLLFEKFDVVHASDLDSFLPALLLAKLRRKIIVYDIFDFYADMIGFPIFPDLFQKLFRKLDKFIMKFADGIIIADDSRIEQIGPNVNSRIISIYNSPEDYFENPIYEPDCKLFSVFFGGGISEDRNIDKVIAATKDLEGIKLTIMGPCPPLYGEKLIGLCNNSKNIKLYLNYFPHEVILKLTQESDLIFSLYETNIPNNKYSSPNKLFEAMMFGKPIIVNDGTSMAEIVKSTMCGVVIPHVDNKFIKDTLLILKNNPEYCKLLGCNGRKAYEEIYCWAIMEKKLLSLYKSLLKGV